MNKKITRISFILCAVVFLFLGCDTDPELERTQIRKRISLKGSFLTESPDEIQFPTKVLFAIDCSLSMGDEDHTNPNIRAGSDPAYLRIDAVRSFINEYNSNPNVSFEVMLWSSGVFSTTRASINNQQVNGFTKDPVELNRVLDGASIDTTTNYLGTLSTIYQDIHRDITNSDQSNLIRTKYIVIFLSDGMSNHQGVTQDENDIFSSVQTLNQMVEDNGVGSFNFHTFLLLGNFDASSSGQAAQQYAESVLQGMSDRGNGQFRLFQNARTIDFINIVDMRLTIEYKLKYIVAYNYNVRAGTELVYVDSDGDGLTDSEEMDVYGTNPLQKDTDGDGLSDFFEIKVSSPGSIIDPLTQDSPCDQMPNGIYPDTDSDGLNDCEEFVKGTDRRIVDSDQDGIPDGIEFFSGTNPLEAQDTTDSDFDGTVDWLEVQGHSNVTSNDPIIRQRYLYSYDLRDAGLVPITQGTTGQSYVRQYDFTISNIDIMDTMSSALPTGGQSRAGDNIIRFYLAEVPEDTPNVPPVFRMVEVTANYSTDENRDIILTPADFMLVE